MFPLEALRGTLALPLPAARGFWHSLTWGRITHVCLCGHTVFSVSVFFSFLSLLQMLVIGFRARMGNPGRSHLKMLNDICKDLVFKYRHMHRFWGLGLGHTVFRATARPATSSWSCASLPIQYFCITALSPSSFSLFLFNSTIRVPVDKGACPGRRIWGPGVGTAFSGARREANHLGLAAW